MNRKSYNYFNETIEKIYETDKCSTYFLLTWGLRNSDTNITHTYFHSHVLDISVKYEYNDLIIIFFKELCTEQF